MHIDDVRRMQAEKDHLMRNEGKHPYQHFPQTKPTTPEEDYEAEDKSIKTHGPESDTYGEAIHRAVLRERDLKEAKKMIDQIPRRK